jgi:hypothetical protein
MTCKNDLNYQLKMINHLSSTRFGSWRETKIPVLVVAWLDSQVKADFFCCNSWKENHIKITKRKLIHPIVSFQQEN